MSGAGPGLYTETCEATHVRGDRAIGGRARPAYGLPRESGWPALRARSGRARERGHQCRRQCGGRRECAADAGALLRRRHAPRRRQARPIHPRTRARVEALSEEVAKVNGAGVVRTVRPRVEIAGDKLVAAASALGYQPLTAEAQLAVGRLSINCSRSGQGGRATGGGVVRGGDVASRSGRDRSRPCLRPGSMPSGWINIPTGRRWLRHGEVVLSRFPGHPILEAWMKGSHSVVLVASGQTAAAIDEMRRTLALLEKVHGPVHKDVAMTCKTSATRS